MNAAACRHGALDDFLALTDGLSIARIAETLRCCTRTVRNYVAGRSPIPWHRIEVLRLRALESNRTDAEPIAPDAPLTVRANIEPDPNAPDVPPDEMLAWVAVHAPHYLSSQRSLTYYVRGWSVVDKIRRAKREGTFAAVLAKWRTLALDLPRSWRSGPLWTGIGPPAYVPP
ncbi:IS21 family transposase [Burkholderia vietnamiensis]|uniref:IS21 family transposase n=1 Tax=Burkholderia vietnamiensis TaxID=60552 RepID=UPI001BA40B4E|nr:IS21 family transposase [Burkholderia vietnamiensis]MBR8280472.1 IS21 family transposase [Burkholderia vietnamiensis]